MPESRKFSQRVSNSDNAFLYKGREDPISTNSGTSSARQRNDIQMAFRWWPNIECWFGSFVKPYIFCDFSGGESIPPAIPTLDPRMDAYCDCVIF